MPRIGILSFDGAPSGRNPDLLRGFSIGLREHGYVEGQNILIERRYADGRADRLAVLAAELVQLKVDVILAGGPDPREAARQATSTIPIVTTSGANPVSEGWARSLARPGGNVTGLTVTFDELAGKRLELLKQAFPQVVRVAVLLDPVAIGDVKAFMQAMETSARPLGLQLQVVEVRGPDDIEAAFTLARKHRVQAVYAIPTNTLVTHSARVAALAADDKLLSISAFTWMAQAGFLMTYGADLDDLNRRAISIMDKILKGARPGDLPIEQPTKFQLIVNVKTARGLGITIPQSLLLRADEVIEWPHPAMVPSPSPCFAEHQEVQFTHEAGFYRWLFWEAGMVGQVLYLEAEVAGVRATGISCFFDDPVHRVFGIEDLPFQSLYLALPARSTICT